jgi:hypothetical protein
MATSTSDYGDRSFTGSYAEAPTGVGWVLFAACMLGLAGTLNFINGILAIGSSRVFVGDQTYVFSDLNTWGWIIMLLGAAQLLASFTVMAGSEFARWFGIAAAGVNAIGQLYFLPANEFWALSLFAVDILIIYALAVYGGARLRTSQ